MKLEKIKLFNKEVMPFTISSGVIMTDVNFSARLLKLVSEIGMWTTKTTGEKERTVPEGDEVLHPDPAKEYGNREPIFAQIDEETFVNSGKFINPGKYKMREHLLSADIPKDRIINCSIFGGTIPEMISVIKTLEDVVDCFEMNGSCPHSEKGGMLIGLDPQIVYNFVKASVKATKKPVLFKFTPNTDKVGLITKAAQEAGAIGVTGINTVGPYIHYFDGYPVLTSKIGGGKSGKGIFERGVECIREARQAVGKNFLIIGGGGVGTAQDVRTYRENGADIVSIGTRLIGMNELQIKNYFSTLIKDLNEGTNNAESLLQKVDMQYKKVTLNKILNSSCDFKILKTNKSINAGPGQFIHAWIPGVGEKPFSVMDNDPLTLGILERGEFTRQINSLKEGDFFYVRGPCGRSIEEEVKYGSNVILVAGGCGLAGIYLPAKRLKLSKNANITSFLAAKDSDHLPYLNEFEKYGEVKVATKDGSKGTKGVITELFKGLYIKSGTYFFNCGPRAMIDKVLPWEFNVSDPRRVYSSGDYLTRCGHGICGGCVDEEGRRTCKEGPFMNKTIFKF